jgi:hypothetical protein
VVNIPEQKNGTGFWSSLYTSLNSWNSANPNSQINITTFYAELNALVNAGPTGTTSVFAKEISNFVQNGSLTVLNPGVASTGTGYTSGRTITIGLPTSLTNVVNGLASENQSVDYAQAFAGILAHELGHFDDDFSPALGNTTYNPSDELTFLTGLFVSEGKAAYNNILLDQAIMQNAPTVNGVTLNGISMYLPPPAPYTSFSAYVSSLQSGTADDAILSLASLFPSLQPSGSPTGTTYISDDVANLPSYITPVQGINAATITSITFDNIATTADPSGLEWNAHLVPLSLATKA